MSYKLSKFNYIVHDDGALILYNTYSKNFMRIINSNHVSQVMNSNSNVDNLDLNLQKKLVAKGFVVPVEDDEQKKGMLKFYESVFDKTLVLTLLATEQCNFRCRYCYESFEKGKMDENVVKGVLAFLKQNLFSYGGLTINWFGGEPLLAFDVIEKFSNEAIMLCRATRKPYMAGITTNGYLLTLDTFRRLLACKVYSYQITIDGICEDHDKFRVLANGEKTFDKIIKNLRDIRDNVNSSLFKISIRSNITVESLKRVNNLVDFLYEEFGQDPRFELFLRPTGDWGGERVHEIKASIMSNFNVYDKLMNNQKFIKLSQSAYRTLIDTNICYAGKRNNFVVGSDGIIYKCTVAFDKDVNKVGMVTVDGKFELDYNKLAKWVMIDDIPEKCRKCFSSCKCCGGTCAAEKISCKEEPGCGHETTELSYVLKIICTDNTSY